MVRLCCLILLLVPLGAVEQELESLFERAEYDTAAMVPLVQEASRALAKVDGAEAVVIADRLQPYLMRLYFSAESFPGMAELGLVQHSVRSGETFGCIAKRHGIGPGHVQRLNPYVQPDSLQVDQVLKVLDCARRPLQIYVWRSRYRLFLLRPDATGSLLLVGAFPVGVGTPDRPTPTGQTHVEMKVRDPQWTDPDTGEVFEPDAPGNVLGGYWIALADGPQGTFDGIGLHGYTGAPSGDWLERGGSRGCIRMKQDDIDAVYGLVVPGVPVAIMD